jgi:hypothetical protein
MKHLRSGDCVEPQFADPQINRVCAQTEQAVGVSLARRQTLILRTSTSVSDNVDRRSS